MNYCQLKNDFVARKNYMFIVFRNEYYLGRFIFTFSSTRLISIGIKRGKCLESFETLRLTSTGTFSRSEIAFVV